VTDRLVTARELAEQLGVSTGALLRWTRAGQVPAVKLPSGAVRYVPDEIDAWLGEHSTAGDATRGVSATPDATRQRDANVSGSATPSRRVAAQNPEESHAR
jgi:excisionase family DNA binding protein